MKKATILSSLVAAVFLGGCCGGEQRDGMPELLPASSFETMVDGKAVSLYTLVNDSGTSVQITNFGARIVDLWVESADGTFKDVVMGFEDIASYLDASDRYNGPVVGRFGNRVGKGRFSLDGRQYQLSVNDGDNHLHGGDKGFGEQVWRVGKVGPDVVSMSYVSPDGEAGYPGNLTITVTYTLTADNALRIDYVATTDAPTIVNPTSHSYFNLHGTNASSTNSHVMEIFASAFTPTDAGLIPTGEIAPVEGTPLDFRTPTPIGSRIDADSEPLRFAGGYDHNWVLEKSGSAAPELAARVWEPSTGIVMDVLTDQPGLQFYSGNFMTGDEVGKRGNVNNHRSGIALETQNFPDAPNHAGFPSAVLRPGETYTHTCVYKFSIRK
ncbi:MAG: galactose mutarotase [Alistipes sp.]|jgi:aldose 1-epimerase|nr:galactose mutarotase [Alistipes sp.]